MSEFSFPFTSGQSGDEGPYSASFFAGFLSGVFGQDSTARNNASVILRTGNGTDDPLEVTQTSPATNEVQVTQGKALVKGYYYYNDSDKNIVVPANNNGSGFARIDIIALEIDFVNQEVRSVIVTGTPAGSPVAPTLQQDSVLWQVPLAQIAVANLFTTIVDANIDNSVKVPYVLWDTSQGGTGNTSYVAGNLLVGLADSTLTKLAVPTDISHLIGDTSKAEKMAWVSKKISIIKNSTTGVALGTSANGTVIPLDNTPVLNPDSFITSISGNQFFLDSGTYRIWGIVGIINGAGAAREAITWIRNNTAGTVVAQGTQVSFQSTNNETSISYIQPREVVSNGTDAFELRGYASGATTAVGTITALTPTGGVAGSIVQIYIEKLKDA